MSNISISKPGLFFFAVFALVLAVAQPAFAQREEVQIRITQVDNSNFPDVTVYISITDANGEPVAINPNLIHLYENGALVQQVQIAGEGEIGMVTTVLVMDVSGSMREGGKLDAAKQAAKAYVTQMRSGDQAGLIAFNTSISYVVPITGDHAALENGIDQLSAQDDTAMYDALIEAVQILENVSGRKAIIVLTDGFDNRSTNTVEDVIEAVGFSSLSISTVGLGDPSIDWTMLGLDEEALMTLASRAGGLYGFAEDSLSLQALYESYGRALQSEYRLTYTSPLNLRDGVNRTLTVSLGEAESLVTTEAQYNPGGVVPEVARRSWTLFLGVLFILVVLVFIPGLIGLILRARKPKKKVRIKLK